MLAKFSFEVWKVSEELDLEDHILGENILSLHLANMLEERRKWVRGCENSISMFRYKKGRYR